MKPAPGIFLVALVLRLIHVWQLRRSPFFDVLLGDAHGYDEWARRIAGGEWIGREVFYQAPLYPYFLGVIYAGAGHSLLAVRLVQALIGSASCALLALAGRRLFAPTVGVVAGLGLAVYAPAIFFDGLLQKSVLDVFFLSLALWLISRLLDEPADRRLWLSLGLAMGALSLTRENALVFIAVILVWCLVRLKPDPTRGGRAQRATRRAAGGSGSSRTWPLTTRVAFAGTFVLGLAIVLLPVAIRNYAVGGGFYLTTSQFGPNFYIGNNPDADGTYMSLRFGRGAPEYERQDATELAALALGRTLTPAEVSSYWTTRALDFITAHPGQWLKLMGRKFVLLWNATEMLDTESQESYAEWSWPVRLGGWFGHFGLLAPLALAGAILAWRDRTRLDILYAMTASYAASVLVFYVFARYRLPLVPLLMLFAAFALVSLPSALREAYTDQRSPRGDRSVHGVVASTGSAICALLVVAAMAVLANWPVLSKPLMKAITETNLAVALQADGRPAEAADHYRRAIAIQPDYAPAYNNLGVTERAIGDVDKAIQTYQRALSVKPDFPDAHYNLANALLEKNRPTEAAEHFRIALQSIPDSAGASNNLGIALAAEGKHDEAVAAFRTAVAADPTSAKAHRNLGDALSSAGRTDEGIAELRHAVQLDPSDADAHDTFGSVLLEAGRLDEAIAEFRAALQLTPRSVEAHNNLGIALGSAGQLDAAIEQFRQALAVDPSFTQSQQNLAMTLKARDDIQRRRR
jgi:tetratricopeptide (TPR) repeat protein